MRGEFVDVGGIRLYYYAAGTRGAGDPVLLLHGFGTSAYVWRHLIPLVPPGHRVIAVDLAGHGRSEASPVADYTPAEHARLVAALLDDLKAPRVHAVAHGLGCEIALRLANGDASSVASLLMVSPAGHGERIPGCPGRDSFTMIALKLGPGLGRAALRRHLARGYVDRANGDRSLERHLHHIDTPSRAAAVRRQIRALDGVRAGPVQAPGAMACVVGSDDPFVDLAAVGNRFSGCTLIDGGRHFLPEEAPDLVAELLSPLLGGRV